MEKSSTPPTTFVKTDMNSFKELVQRLTGPHRSSEPETATSGPSSPRLTGGVRKPQPRLHERRQGHRSKLTILRPSELLHASDLSYWSPSSSKSCDFGNLVLNKEEEEKAIQERRFYLHPSPRSAQAKAATPELLHLFPDNSSCRDDIKDD